jgi:hypothetical protein
MGNLKFAKKALVVLLGLLGLQYIPFVNQFTGRPV